MVDLKNHILQYNPYLNAGFENAYQSVNGVYQGETILFPNDTLGDYFYLRPNNPTTITRANQISGCRTSFVINNVVTLVAVVKDANAIGLVNNLINTLSTENSTINSINTQHEAIIQQELGRMTADQIAAAQANYHRSKTIVSINFTFFQVLPVLNLNCLPNPCQCTG